MTIINQNINSNYDNKKEKENEKGNNYTEDFDLARAMQAVRKCLLISATETISNLFPLSINNSASEEAAVEIEDPARIKPQQFIFIDIRSSQEIVDSGGGSIPKALQFEPEFVDQPDALDVWIQHFDSAKGENICIIDLPPGQASGVSLLRRLILGEGDGYMSQMNSIYSTIPGTFVEEKGVIRDIDSKHVDLENVVIQDDRVRPAVKLATALHKASFPNVCVLEGGFPKLVQTLLQTRGTVEPLIDNYRNEVWEKYLSVTGRTEYLPPRKEKPSKRSSNISSSSSTTSTNNHSKSDTSIDENSNTEVNVLLSALRISQKLGHRAMEAQLQDRLDHFT